MPQLVARGLTIDIDRPMIMAVINATPDSFSDAGKYATVEARMERTREVLAQGADILDIGGQSAITGVPEISEDEEIERITPVIEWVATNTDAIMSIDTYRPAVAAAALDAGAHIINDIAAGRYDAQMLATVAKHRAPYIIMHMQGMPADMQRDPQYGNVLTEVIEFMSERVAACKEAGIIDVIIDPGYGFGKTVQHNYTLLRNQRNFEMFNLPILAGVSRKSMVCKVLGVNPDKALNGTTAVNTLALLNGANLLRVHDVKEAVECIKLVNKLK